MKDLSEARQHFVIEITNGKVQNKLWLFQDGYIEKVMKSFYLGKFKLIQTLEWVGFEDRKIRIT